MNIRPQLNRLRLFYLTAGLAALATSAATGHPPAASGAIAVQIKRTEAGGFSLWRDGTNIRLQGAVLGDAPPLPGVRSLSLTDKLNMLQRSGANAVRLGPRRSTLDAAQACSMLAVVDIFIEGERDGMEWNDDAKVAAQTARALATVRELKDHPAVVAWALGNEIDYIPPNKPYNPRIWQRLNAIAQAVKEIDPNHLVLTVIGDSYFEAKVKELARDGTAFDLLGLNAYGALPKTVALLRQHWPKPYLVTEWGPTGHWEVTRTLWGAPIEQTSSEKAVSIDDRYRRVIRGDDKNCLGSFVFYWSEKQETTHTWYGLFCEGLRTQAIDVMQRNWSGRPPANLAPTIEAFDLNASSDKRAQILRPGQEYAARLAVLDLEGDELLYAWDVRPEVVIPKNNYGGGKEVRAAIMKELILGNSGSDIRFVAPRTEGAYRLFVTVRDGKGSIAYANFPFYVSASGAYNSSNESHL